MLQIALAVRLTRAQMVESPARLSRPLAPPYPQCGASQVALVKKRPANEGRCKRQGFDPWVGKILWREGNGNPLQYSYLENPTDRGARWAAVCGVTESGTTEATQQQQQFTGDSNVHGLQTTWSSVNYLLLYLILRLICLSV